MLNLDLEIKVNRMDRRKVILDVMESIENAIEDVSDFTTADDGMYVSLKARVEFGSVICLTDIFEKADTYIECLTINFRFY